jgi:hypothetical protein
MYKKAEEKFREAMEDYEIACGKGSLHETEAHQLSLGNGADLHLMISQFVQPPLSWAAEKGHKAVVKLPLRTGEVDVNLKDMDGWIPLSRAAGGGHLAVVERVWRRKNSTPGGGRGRPPRGSRAAATGEGRGQCRSRAWRRKNGTPGGGRGRPPRGSRAAAA